MLSRRSTLA